ncbi:DNA (cytosine-5-)-methyltransferase [Mycobacterium sp. 852002-51163_SCH5372311]|nr:DNA (cytosine-5-)-methyltransferase [Mycobacterium sp. 852002-51163_SCH5372311]
MVDLFAGAGGLSEGFRQAGCGVVAGNDNDPDAAATYALNFPEATTVVGDLRRSSVREQVLAAARGVDIIVGGPPCQAFSQVRNHTRLIDDPRNSLYREFVQVVREVLPAAFLMENVPGMAQMGIKEQVTEDLSLDGEYLVTPQLVDAADFGVPQTRKRLLFIGIRSAMRASPHQLTGSGITAHVQLARVVNDTTEYHLAARPSDDAAMLRRLDDPYDLTAVTALQAIGDLEGLVLGRRADTLADGLPPASSAYQKLMRSNGSANTLENVSVPRANADTILRLRSIPPGGNHRDLPDELLDRYLTGAKWGPHNGTGTLSRRHYYAYRRLHPAIWAWTLNTKADSVYHYRDVRCLSVREFARLQSFPDRFVFTTDPRRGPLSGRIDGGSAHSRYRQAGNAVPPLLAAAAAREIVSLLQAWSQAQTA